MDFFFFRADTVKVLADFPLGLSGITVKLIGFYSSIGSIQWGDPIVVACVFPRAFFDKPFHRFNLTIIGSVMKWSGLMLFILSFNINPGIYMLLKCRQIAFASRCPDVVPWRGRSGVGFLCHDGCSKEQTYNKCFEWMFHQIWTSLYLSVLCAFMRWTTTVKTINPRPQMIEGSPILSHNGASVSLITPATIRNAPVP